MTTISIDGRSVTDLRGQLRGYSSNYKIKLDAGKSYKFSVQTENARDNVGFRLVDGRGEIVGSSSDSGGSDDPRLNYIADRSGYYTVQIFNEQPSTRGNVKFNLTIDDIDTSPAPTARASSRVASIGSLADAQLNTTFQNLIQDKSLSFSDLQTLLASTGANDGIVTAPELEGLRQIANGLSNYVSATSLDYYGYLFDAVVYGNPANKSWTGGQQKSIDLGNLKSGSSDDHLQKLIGKWFRGEDLPLALIGGDAARNKKDDVLTYGYATGPIFDGPISYTDMFQGDAGTCYFLAAAASIANATPSRIESMLIDNGNGTYGVKFHSSGTDRNPLWVTVNRQLPLTDEYGPLRLKLAGGSSDRSPDKTLWPALLEKAYAQANEIGQFEEKAQKLNSYKAVEGGLEEGLGQISGSSIITAGREISQSSVELNDFVTAYKDPLTGAILSKKAAIIGSELSSELNGKEAFVGSHMFAIIDYKPETDSFTFFNPWGLDDASSRHLGTFNYSLSEAVAITSNNMAASNDLAWIV